MLSRDQQSAAEHAQDLQLMEVEVIENRTPSVSAVVPMTIPHGSYDMRRAGARQIVDAIDLCMN